MSTPAISFDDVFRYAYQEETILKALLGKVQLTVIAQAGGEQKHRIFLSIFEDIYSEHDRAPSSIEMRNLIGDALAEHTTFGQVDAELKDGLYGLLDYMVLPLSEIDLKRSSSVAEFLSDVYRTHVGKPMIETAYKEAAENGDYEKLQLVINEVNSQSTTFRQIKTALDASQTETLEAMPTGITWLDEMIGGGLGRMLAYGILIPTGCGKTTLASQVAVSMALQGRKVSLIFSEQSMREREMIDRFRCLVFNESIDEVKTWSKEMPHQVSENPARLAMWNAIQENLQILDKDDCPTSVEELEALMAGVNGDKPEVMFIDWVGYLAKGMLTNKLDSDKNYTITTAIQDVADSMAAASSRHCVPCLIFQQVRGALARAAPTKNINIDDGEQCKSMHNNLAYGLTIGTHDPNGNCMFNVSKSRYSNRRDKDTGTGNPNSRIINFDNKKLRFTEVRNFKISNGKFVPAKAQDDKMPSSGEKRKPGELRVDLSDKGSIVDV